MRLIHEPTGCEVKIGDTVKTFRGVDVILTDFTEGRVCCKDEDGRSNEWFPSVIRCRVVFDD